MMEKYELIAIMLFPLYVAIGVLVFSITLFVFGFDIMFVQIGMCFAFGSCFSEIIIVKLFESDLKKVGMW